MTTLDLFQTMMQGQCQRMGPCAFVLSSEVSESTLRFAKRVERPEFDRKRRSFIFGSRN